jgi:hypothetical protein
MAIARTWLGGGNNEADNPRDWSPKGAPQPGDSLTILSGTINVDGHDLAGDALTATGSSGTVNINTSPGATLNLVTTDFPIVNVHVNGTLNLNAQVAEFFGQHVNFSGGTIKFIGTSSFAGADTVFNDNLTGSALIKVNHLGNSSGSGFLEINGSVGNGLTFALEASGPPESMQIDHPNSFKGIIELPPVTPSTNGSLNLSEFLGNLTFEGLHVTRADLSHPNLQALSFLKLYDGTKLVDTVEIKNSTNISLHQGSTGVVLTQSSFGQAGIPIHMH